jgi:hypothetical protein
MVIPFLGRSGAPAFVDQVAEWSRRRRAPGRYCHQTPASRGRHLKVGLRLDLHRYQLSDGHAMPGDCDRLAFSHAVEQRGQEQLGFVPVDGIGHGTSRIVWFFRPDWYVSKALQDPKVLLPYPVSLRKIMSFILRKEFV